ncbi:MAG: hypothetical protein QUS33_12595 [Dehalococcoidia bacterium]|nr:hypothetical protein [Dehalococcoidia bacterium]
MATSAITDTKGYLADVPEEYVFWCCDGRILKNLRELCDALSAMSEDTFAYHVNAAKNDFYNWVKDIIKDDVLAGNLLKAANARDAFRVVTERITSLSSKPARTTTKKTARRKTARR